MPREELKSRLHLPTRIFNGAIQRMTSEGQLREAGATLALVTHEVRFDAQQQVSVDRLMRQFEESPYSPPSTKDCAEFVGDEVVAFLVSSGRLVAVSPEVVFRKVDYDSMVSRLRDLLAEKGQLTLAEVRDLFHTSRKYAQALLEHLDSIGVTRRSGDVRLLSR